MAAIAVVAVCLTAPHAWALQAATPQSQSSAASPATTAPEPASIEGPLRSALDRVGTALNQVRIDRWKLPKQQKVQFQDDAGSIQQDLATTLPGLFAAMRQSPQAMQPQWAMMHNVNALYDVLVRITTAAEISAGKGDDAALLAQVTQQLEAARNQAATRMLQTASARDQDLARVKQEVRATKEKKSTTIVVNNSVSHRKSHRKEPPRRTPH